MTDAPLNNMTRDGDAMERFVQLLATAQRPVFLCAVCLLHHAQDAEEVLQETNLVLWRKFDQYQPGTDFVAWACRIARLESLQYRRRKRRDAIPFSDEFLERLADEVEQHVDHWSDRRTALASCLEKLPTADRTLVERRYQWPTSTRELAAMLGRSDQGVRRSLQRIRTALLQCIERATAAEERR